jgi:hypothetical protein
VGTHAADVRLDPAMRGSTVAPHAPLQEGALVGEEGLGLHPRAHQGLRIGI